MDINQLGKELWVYLVAIVPVWIGIFVMLSKHITAARLLRDLVSRLPLWMSYDMFGDKKAVPPALAETRTGDRWFSHITLNAERNPNVLQSIEECILASRLPLCSKYSYASLALTGICIFVFLFGFLLKGPAHTPASASGLAQHVASVELNTPEMNQANVTTPAGKSKPQNLSQSTGSAKGVDMPLLMFFALLLVAVGFYGMFLLLGYIFIGLPSLLSTVRILCGELGLVKELAPVNGKRNLKIVSAEEDPRYQDLLRLK